MIQITGLEETEELLDRLKSLDKAMKEVCKELCEMAQTVVESKYSVWSYAGNTDYNTEIEELPDGFRLTAYGEDIGFLEFGAGVFTEPDEFASQVGYDVRPGSWSETEGTHQFEYHQFWMYGNVKYTGITPSRGMHYALEEVLNNVYEMAKRKIDEWITGK